MGMAMIGLICLIFGFWIGKNCSAHSLSRLCCKWCVFWCDDDKVNDFDDEYDEESAWNWKSNASNSNHSNKKGVTKKYKTVRPVHGSMDLSRDSNDNNHTITPITNINHKVPINRARMNNYQTMSQNNYSNNNNK